MKFFISLIFTLALISVLDRSWMIGDTRVPPAGKFFDPLNGFWQNTEAKGFNGPGELTLAGLQDKVTVVYDSLLIPHIFAGNDEDLYLTQGFVTAVHRLWQMEFQTHAAAGKVASILGPGPDSAFLKYDRKQRRLGLPWAAIRNTEGLMKDPVTRMMVEKYTEGVNAHIRSLRYKQLPLEYKLLDYRPEDWTPEKVGLLFLSMAQSLNIGDKDIEMTNALQLFGKDAIDLLYPDRESVTDPVVDNPGGWNFDPEIINTPLALPKELIKITSREKPDPTIGSNNWAVSGSKTATGSPILCNDPHLSTTIPSIWFVVHLNSPSVNVMGSSLPGAPGVVIGFNDSIAWGLTNAQRDLVDWYKIRYQDKSRERYLLDNSWMSAEKKVESIPIRGSTNFYDTVVYTHWGPVTYDETFPERGELTHYAFRWIAHDPSKELLAIYKINRANNFDDYIEAINYFSSPAQNVAFASVTGDIAIRVQGKFPVRRKDEGKFVLDGTSSTQGWQSYIPMEQNIMTKNPARGFVSSANQYPADETYPYYITATSYEAYRNRRINDVLEGSTNITVKDMMALQNDNYNLKASESLPLFLSYLDSATLSKEETEAYRILKNWDYYNEKDSEGASYYEAWWDNLMPLLWDEMLSSPVSLSLPTTYNTIKLIKEQPSLSFFDIVNTPEKETAPDVIRKSFLLAVEDIQAWQSGGSRTGVKTDSERIPYWADFKRTYIRHLARIESLGFFVRHGGNHDIVNASTTSHGPSWRMVVSLEKTGVKAFGVYPGGQSGNPGSKFYNNMLNHWADGKYFRLHFPPTPEALDGKILYSTNFNSRPK